MKTQKAILERLDNIFEKNEKRKTTNESLKPTTGELFISPGDKFVELTINNPFSSPIVREKFNTLSNFYFSYTDSMSREEKEVHYNSLKKVNKKARAAFQKATSQYVKEMEKIISTTKKEYDDLFK